MGIGHDAGNCRCEFCLRTRALNIVRAQLRNRWPLAPDLDLIARRIVDALVEEWLIVLSP